LNDNSLSFNPLYSYDQDTSSAYTGSALPCVPLFLKAMMDVDLLSANYTDSQMEARVAMVVILAYFGIRVMQQIVKTICLTMSTLRKRLQFFYSS
jgi:hypothetical protein